MAEGRHSVRKQTLRVTASSEALALAIRPQIEAMNRSAFLEIIERVFDEFAGSELHFRIDRLEIDLGLMLAIDFERQAPGRFEQALREQLLLALHGTGAGGARAETRTPAEARAEAVEQLLLTGTLPFWAAHESPAPEAALLEWIARDPAAIRRLFRRHRANDAFMRRIVLTLSDAGLARLLQTLSPDEAAAMVVYLTEIRALHRVEPVIPVTDTALGRMLWAVTLDYVSNDTGSQFNRKSFVRTLLAGIAESERLTYQDILSVFDLGLPTPAVAAPVAATLLEVVAALVDDEKRVDPRFAGAASRRLPDYHREDVRFDVPFRYDVADALRYYLRFGELPWSIRLRHPGISLADYLVQLPFLPAPLLDSLVEDLPAEDWSDRWQHLLGHLSDDQLESLAGTLAPERTQLRSLLSSALAAGRVQRRVALVRVLAAVLTTAPEPRFDGSRELPRPSFPLLGAPDADHVVRSLLTARLVAPSNRDVAAAEADAAMPSETIRSATALLARLVDEHPASTRVWLQELRRAGHSPEALVDVTPDGAMVDALRRRLSGPAADVVQVVMATLAALQVADRSHTDEQVRRILLEEMLAAWSSPMSARALQDRLFARLFPKASGGTGELVLAVAARLAEQGTITEASRQLFAGDATSSDASDPRSDATTAPDITGETESDADAIARWLAGTGPDRERESPAGYDRDTLNDALHRMIAVPSAMTSSVRRHLSDARARARWARGLSESNRARIFGVLAAGDVRLLEAAERLFAGSRPAAGGGDGSQRERFWLFLFEFLANTPPSARTIEALTRQFFAFVGGRHRAAAASPSGAPDPLPRPTVPPPASAPSGTASAAGERTWQGVLQRAERDGDAALQQVLRRDREVLRQAWEGTATASATPPPIPTPSRARTAFSLDDEREAGQGAPIYIANAGLVIAAPFLPRLFQALEMTEIDAEGKTRIRPVLLSRAVHLLQWAVTGRTDTPEPSLCLNKLLCGVAIAVPVEPGITPTPRELEIGTTLLNSIIVNWTIIKGTSIDGLRETFLQREGRLERITHGWRLEVQRKTLDVLLDQLPWSVSTVMHSLMPEPIFVKW